jgi:hypothetical protein
LTGSFSLCTVESVSPTNRIIDTPPPDSFRALRLHEATHAAVALALGLTVEEVRVTGALSLDEATERLYGLEVGAAVPAAGTRIPDEFLETHPRELLAAMAAPSFMPTGVVPIDRYAEAEAAGAAAAARERGVDPAEVIELSAATVAAQVVRIRDLAEVLEREGGWSPGDGREGGSV